nr:DUF2293 domain-containing protein [Amycolatopsis nigrescens]
MTGRPKLQQRVFDAAEASLKRSKYLAPVELLAALGWLPDRRAELWRRGRLDALEQALEVDAGKAATAVEYLRSWAEVRQLQPVETRYLAATRDRRPLRFTLDGAEAAELAFRTHWVSPELSEKRLEQLVTRQNKAPDLVVISPEKDWACAECALKSAPGEFLFEEDGRSLCLSCADFGHLVFLPAGNAALSRRAKKESALSAVVMRFNRRRKRSERLGILVGAQALERAENQCLADEDLRARRRERDAERRASQDLVFQAAMAEQIRHLYPGCPADRAAAIAEHAGARGSGRVGRSAAGRALDEQAVRLAVVASVRHLDTPYDELLMSSVPREQARERIRDDIDRVLDGWAG